MRSVRFALVTMGLLGCIGGSSEAQQTSSIPLKRITIRGDFAVSEGAAATDISGMACLPEGTPRKCLLVNDENKNAQFATIQDDRMVVGDPVPLIGSAPDSRTFGRPPDETCEKADDFRDLDGEGVAYAEPYFYVVGSHGCGRSRGKFRLSSFILARVRVDRQGQPVDRAGRPLARENFAQAVETTYRVSDLLQRAGKAAAFFGKDLESADGLNIEGVAVQGDTIWFGLRGPVRKNKTAYLVSGDIADLFKAGNKRSKAKPEVVPIDLDGLGIRDLAPLPDKRLLVVAGAAHGPEVPFKLFVVDPAKDKVTRIGPLAAVTGQVDGEMKTGKAEGVTVLDMTGDKAQIVILFDSLPNGAPHLANVSIPARNKPR
ncbi:DUF6910 family protein [Bradyrhizobium algeriense]|uniref:DUF6910 family protein n=1 Tax=Bradyrhizobium algeriense TaxID=634784 RepID=UPI001FCE36D6|nr:DUF3616 domain-containing protein [Bradyrhizobium algeriense]